VLHGGADSCNPPSSSEGKEHFFTSLYQRQVIEGAGHFPQREAPKAVAKAILDFVRT
jgi:pimeloyl-ACP methyl ester carboxylesterase